MKCQMGANAKMTSMKTITVFAFLMYVVSASAEPPRSVERPEVVLGESWTYAGYENENKFTLKVEIDQLSDKDIRVVVTPNGLAGLAQLQVFDRQWNQIEVFKDGSRIVRFSPYLPVFKFPLEVGKVWAQHYDWQRMDLGDGNSGPETWAESRERKASGRPNHGSTRVEGKVLGWEEISVPAGIFTALKIELKSPHYAGPETRRIFGKAELFGGLLETYWYVPEVKRFVKYESRLYINQQLKSSNGLDLVEHSMAPKAAPPGPTG